MQTRKQSILIVDDDPVICRMLKQDLERVKFHVDTAIDGRTGIEMANDNHYDLVLLDLHLPDCDGLQISEHIPHPFVAMSGSSSGTVKDMAQQMGALAFLAKPFKIMEHLANIQKIIEVGKQRYREKQAMAARRNLNKHNHEDATGVKFGNNVLIAVGCLMVDKNLTLTEALSHLDTKSKSEKVPIEMSAELIVRHFNGKANAERSY